MENNTFTYNYSARRNREVEKIRRKYLPQEESKLERLKQLDERVRMAGTIEALCFGVLGALVFGIGMCFLLGVFAGGVWIAVLFMIIGMLTMLFTYPGYRHIAEKTRAELTPEILRLSEEIINSQKIED